VALSVKGGTFNSPTSTGNAAVTGVGFTPKLLMLYSTLATDAGAMSVLWGVGTSSSARWSASTIALKATNASAYRMYDSTKIVRTTTQTGLSFLTADLVSLDSDGFTLNWTLVFSSGLPINYLCLGGTDLSVKVGFFDSNTSVGNQSVTGVGFTPKSVMAACIDVPSLDGTGFGAGNLSIGATSGASNQSSVVTNENAVVAGNTDSNGGLIDGKLWSLTSASATFFCAGQLVSLDSDGFTVNVTLVTAATALRIGYVALGGASQHFVSNFAQPGSTGNQAITSVGFTPSVDLFWSGGKTAGVGDTDNARLMFGASVSSSDRGVIWTSQKDNSGAPAESRATLRTKSLDMVTDNTTTVLADADFVSQDSDGFTNNWTTADATARSIAFLSIGAAAATSARAKLLPLLGVS